MSTSAASATRRSHKARHGVQRDQRREPRRRRARDRHAEHGDERHLERRERVAAAEHQHRAGDEREHDRDRGWRTVGLERLGDLDRRGAHGQQRVERPRAPADRSVRLARRGHAMSRRLSVTTAAISAAAVQPTRTTPAAPIGQRLQPGPGDALRGAERRHVEDRRVDRLHQREHDEDHDQRAGHGDDLVAHERAERNPEERPTALRRRGVPPATSATSPAPTCRAAPIGQQRQADRQRHGRGERGHRDRRATA